MFGGTTGIIEGFYGRPWSWDERLELMAWCHERGMSHYVYAPKDDPLHRARWREPYGADDIAGFERLVGADTLRVGFALSPGLSIDYGSSDDRAALATKIDQVTRLGIDQVVLALDDIPPRPGLGTEHGELATWLADHLGDRARVVLVPTDYTSTRSTPYLDELAATCPVDVPIAWTGPTVVCDAITAADAQARADALGGRLPFGWDNYPVNDALMGDRLFLGPLRGRDPGLAEVSSGWLANPMVQPVASKLPLASMAAFLRGDDPRAVWEQEADGLGWRTFAEACDGFEPRRLVDAVIAAEGGAGWSEALGALRAWLAAAASCAAPGLEAESGPWVEQVRSEVAVCKQCVRTLEAQRAAGPRSGQEPDPKAATESMLVTIALWQIARRGSVSALGPRCGFRAVLSQRDDAEWRFHRTSVTTDASATDRLVDYTLDVMDRAG